MATILLVEDDEPLRTMLAEVLRRAGHEVQQARDGNEATKIYTRDPADLIVTDLIMPDKEGLQTIREIRKACPSARIIAMSGGGRKGTLDYLTLARRFGAQQVLDKPFSHGEILEAVRTVLEQPVQ